MCVGGCPHIRVREILKRSLAAVITRKSRRKWYHIRTNWFRACVCANEISVVLWSFSCCCCAVAIAAPVTHDLPLVGYLLAIKEQWVALSRLPWILFKVKYRFSVHSSTSTPFTRVRTHPQYSHLRNVICTAPLQHFLPVSVCAWVYFLLHCEHLIAVWSEEQKKFSENEEDSVKDLQAKQLPSMELQ